MYVGLGAAILWSISAAVLLFSAISALNTFCSCAGAIPACSKACTGLRALLASIATFLVVLLGACAAMMINPANMVAATTIVIAAVALTVNLFVLLAVGLALGSCQRG
jgi:hypothetical protein